MVSGGSLRALARRLDVSLAAVQKAARNGRLARSLGRTKGRPVILDMDLAEAEWRESTTRAAVRSGRLTAAEVEALAVGAVAFTLTHLAPDAILTRDAEGGIATFDPRRLLEAMRAEPR